MRLRQIALVGADLAAAEADIRAVLGLGYAYDDPGVGKFGLKNAVFPVGNTFLEVVSPKQPGTTAGRLLEKRGGDGGYMVILQVDDIAEARARIAHAGARTVEQADLDGGTVAMSHVHPKDVGGAILSLDYMSPPERWQWGGPVWREATVRLVRDEIRDSLAKTDPWTWLAERNGRAVGLLVAQPPQEAGWIAGMTSKSPAAYLQTMFVDAQERGTGIGAALVRNLHVMLDGMGVAVTLLHHSQVNPLSAPFWYRMGYRPLWTSWEARPASALR